MICPACGRETDGVNHNRRGLRCGMCWALLPLPVQVEPEKVTPPAEPVKRGRKSVVKDVKDIDTFGSREEYEK